MVDIGEKSVRIKDLSEFQGISESYLSKTFSKLAKAGIVQASPGVKGGYSLGRDSKEISFWDVIEAVEGKESLFQCQEIRCKSLFADVENQPEVYRDTPCLISKVMYEGENAMREYLSKKSIGWLYEEVFYNKFSDSDREKTLTWFQERSS